MALFQWDKSYCVGIDEVDMQHEKLVGMVNRLDEAVRNGRDANVIDTILKEALDYTQYHFATEERLMEQAGMTGDHYRRHKIEHVDFVKTVVGQVGELQARRERVSEALLKYLVRWLVEHILGSDREMARLLGERPDARPLTDREAILRDRDLERAEEKLLAALNESEWRFRVIADSAPVLIWMCGADGRRGFFNRRWSEFTGVARERLETNWADCIHPDDRALVLARYTPGATPTPTVEYRLRAADGGYRWVLETVEARRTETGDPDGYVGSCVDVTDLKRHEEILQRQVDERTADLREANLRLEQANQLLEKASRTDGLLGIANRMHFDDGLAREWRRAVREGTPLALLMLDVDHFKKYNDRYGHQAGDDCLRAIARAARTALRRPADLLARYGGEELVIMLPNTTVAGARTVAQAVREAVIQLRLPHSASPVAEYVTVSIGVAAIVPERGSQPDALITAADEALYTAKAAGRDRVQG